MGCGSSSTQVKEFKHRQDTPNFKHVENHSGHLSRQDARIKSASSQSSKRKDKSTSSSASSLKERVHSGKSSRSSSAKSDRYKKETERDSRETKDETNLVPAVHKDEFTDVTEFKSDETKNHKIHQSTISNPLENIDDNANKVDKTEREFNEKETVVENQRLVITETKTEDTIVKKAETDDQRDGTVDKEGYQGEETECSDEYDEFADLDLTPISVPETDLNKELREYTIDDVVNHNTEKGRNNWFLYGRKVYSVDLFIPIVFNRMQEYFEMTNQAFRSPDKELSCGSYPVYVARWNGVRRKELDKILPATQIGKLASLSREEYLSRLKHCVDNVKTALEAEAELNEYLVDYLEQLSRWLSNYPNVELENPVDRNNVDPNQCEFPLPDKIRADSTVLRKWARDWELFDLTLDEGGAWELLPLLNEDLGDVHQLFADLVAQHVDENIPELNMEIEGEASWDVIPLDIFKNDETTKEQEDVWRARENRNDLNDPERMRRRRKQIADSFLKRHDVRLKPDDMLPFVDWATRLEEHWKEFQKLCETFVARPRKADEPKKLSDNTDKDEQMSEASEDMRTNPDAEPKSVSNEPKSLPDNIPPHDTLSLLSDHGVN